ncbi:hypothetical protein I3842_05G111000 [Carya illinoinensis]|uniref:DC1 domain-containing protein n=1 Tax=Carya illinoinensis TaxID=32201 RepID=A0A922JPS4_CARIL|nr:hypothetical protein I3842_05G111000 [Carya illinoinensis]
MVVVMRIVAIAYLYAPNASSACVLHEQLFHIELGTYEYDAHLFLTLTYTVEDNSGEYYCFICEETRDSRKWFYYCKGCDFAAHPDCVIGKYSRFKFGRNFTCQEYHRHHPLAIVKKNEYSSPCDSCGATFDGLAVACTQCKFNSHLKATCPWWQGQICERE